MTTSIYSVFEASTNKTIARELPSVGAAVKFIKNLGRNLNEFRIEQIPVSFSKSIKNKIMEISGCSDEDISLIEQGGVLPIYNNPAQMGECDMVIVFSENKVLVGKLNSKEEYSPEAAPLWKNIKGRHEHKSWNTSLFFDNSISVFDRTEFEKNNYKLRGTQGGIGYKNSELNLEF
jgi:hypothetical protein